VILLAAESGSSPADSTLSACGQGNSLNEVGGFGASAAAAIAANGTNKNDRRWRLRIGVGFDSWLRNARRIPLSSAAIRSANCHAGALPCLVKRSLGPPKLAA